MKSSIRANKGLLSDQRKPLRTGVVGLGKAAIQGHLPAIARSAFYELVAVADASENATRGSECDGIPAYRSLQEMIRDEDLDVVSVCTPPDSHLSLVRTAVEAGLAVLLEKPIAHNLKDAEAIVALSKTSYIAMMHNYLFMPEIQSLLDAFQSGALGSLRHVDIDLLGVLDLPGLNPADPNWRHDRSRSGGGILIDMIHVLYIAESFAGPIKGVNSAYVELDEGGLDVMVAAHLECQQANAEFCLAWGEVGPGRILVLGTDAAAWSEYAGGGTPPFASLDRVVVRTSAGLKELTRPALHVNASSHQQLLDSLASSAIPTLASTSSALRHLEIVSEIYAKAGTL